MSIAQQNDPAALVGAPRRMTLPPLGVAGVVFLFALICFLPLPAWTPIAGTEGHRSMTAHLMVQSGEWIVPRLFGRVYLAKPPLHYWIIGAFEKFSGRATPFVWRLPSAIEASLTAAILSLFASRWFGRVAGWVSGICFVALIALWGENRGADIDVSNTLSANLAALCLLELHFGFGKGRARWIFGAGIAIGASLLVKGPAGMTIILGSLLWIAVDDLRNRKVSTLRKASFWMPPLIGVTIFGVYLLVGRMYLKSHGFPMDPTGLQEGMQDLHPHDWSLRRAIEWIFLPATLFLYSLPVSIALPLSMFREVRGEDARRSRLMTALAASVLLAWTVCFISGMHLPRYAYVTLPLLCPLAGAVASGAYTHDSRFRPLIRAIVFWTLVGFGIAVVVVCGMLWRHSEIRPLLVTAALVAVIIAGVSTAQLMSRVESWRPLWGVPALLLVLSTGIARFAHYERLKRSSIVPGQWIREQTGPNAELVTCAMVLDQPELFYYSGLSTRATNGETLDWRPLKLGTWVVLEAQELKIWKAEVPDRLRKVMKFTANHNDGYLVWYAEAGPATGPSAP